MASPGGGPVPTLEREAAAWSRRELLIGLDEVGRGPLAGPVLAAAVVFPPSTIPVPGIRDSKTLSARQRAELVPRIGESALALAIGAASVGEIDRLNIRRATALAMRRAFHRLFRAPALRAHLAAEGVTGYRAAIDGLPLPECGFIHEAIVDGDALCYSIAAAGILAKEVRDRLMRLLAGRYPGFGWQHNVGYGTAAHRSALARLGPTSHHRRSFAPVSQLALPLIRGRSPDASG